ncbi:MAG: hypothetical protein J6Q53_03250 [Oscillospiraceae bacterium]|nr:hypothetical protein [Oscillospiraceae bacterium]
MYGILKTHIAAGGFKLGEIQHKVKKLYVLGDLTEEQTDELLAMASHGVSADAERPEVMDMLRSLADRVTALEKKLAAQEDAGEEQPQYAAWKPWDGISDKYQLGAIVAHKDRIWESTHNGQNVWEPGAAGTEALWKDVTEEVTANDE